MPAGAANHVFQLGADMVLRIPRSSSFARDLRTEADVIPLARGLGIRTPAVVAYDDSCSVVDVPYMVVERARGTDLCQRDLPPQRAVPVLREVGRQLGVLHRETSVLGARPPGVPAADEGGDPEALVAELLVAGQLDPGTARWLTGWFQHLTPYRPLTRHEVLVHGDVSPPNVLVTDTGDLGALVDWGDATWADPATDFAKLPLTVLPAVLDGYRQEIPDRDSTQCWEARVLWYHLAWALARLRNPEPVAGGRHWTAPPASRLLGILRFFAGEVPEPWRSLVPPHS